MNQSYCDINISYHHNNGEEKVRKLHKFSNAVGYKVFLCPSFGAPFRFYARSGTRPPRCSHPLDARPYGDSEDARYILGGSTDFSRRCHEGVSEVYALGNIGGVANEAGFNGSQTYVHGRMIICPVSS